MDPRRGEPLRIRKLVRRNSTSQLGLGRGSERPSPRVMVQYNTVSSVRATETSSGGILSVSGSMSGSPSLIRAKTFERLFGMGNSASSSGASPAVHVDAAVLEKLEARAAAAEAKIARLEAAKGANPAAQTPPTPSSAAQVTAAYVNELQSLRLVLVAAEKEHEALVKQVKGLEEKNGGWP